MSKIVFIDGIWLRGVYAKPSKYAAYGTTHHQTLRWLFAEKTVHEWATNKRMTVHFVHSCNIRGRFAIPHKACDDVISPSKAAFRWYRRISP
ncbi:MAG: hypothetical protein ACOY16_00745 [Chloroflexota bacterium]